MTLRINEILKEKGKSKYWLYIQMMPFSNFARTPKRLKLFIRSISMWMRLGFACFIDSAAMPNVRYFVLVRPLLPWARDVYKRQGCSLR